MIKLTNQKVTRREFYLMESTVRVKLRLIARCTLAIYLATFCLSLGYCWADDRPNVLWIISDDLGPELGCYGYPDVATPNIDRLAAGGRRFTKAFSTAPVCSSSRTAFITGRYQTSVGGHHHNTRDKRELPSEVIPVTEMLRHAGYFISNGYGVSGEKRTAKSHFNFVYNAGTFFDGNDWSQRSDGQPFFACVQIKEPHRVFKRADRLRDEAPIHQYYPEHPITRADWSNYLASVEAADQKVGQVMDRLEREGDLDNTLIFFFGDHGRPHVRGKQWLYDGGLHTPLIVHWPGHIRPGEATDRLASLLDLMPTTLAAAGVESPELPGIDLLAADWAGHDTLFAARDRCGDAADRIRSVRTNDFKYIRNFYPDRPYLQHSGYKKLQYPVLTLMRVLHAEGKWESPMMSPTRPPEELYDLRSDPHEMNNLATKPEYQSQLQQLRRALDAWILQTHDQGAVDESETVEMDALMMEKWRYYEKNMQRRGLDPLLSDGDYLRWWEEQLLGGE